MRKLLFSVLTVTCLLACASGDVQRDEVIVFEPDPALPFERCITASTIRSTAVLDDQNILFYMRNGAIYRNFLPRRCPGLGRRAAFSYQSSTNSLCNVDHIKVLDNASLTTGLGATCALGGFYPISEAEADAIRLEIERIRQLGLDRNS